jgi:post-segregation antitoxin (ccd killing protein)
MAPSPFDSQLARLEEAILPAWLRRLRSWAFDGRLEAAVLEALRLRAGDPRLATLLAERAAGNAAELPEIRLVEGSAMEGLAGAYSPLGRGGMILLNRTWLSAADDASVLAVLTEEFGHHLDRQFNSSDTPGDEGEVFSARLRGLIPASSAFSEDDHRLISLNGRSVAIEAYQVTTGSVMDSGGRPSTGKTLTGSSRRKEPCATEKMRLSVTLPRNLYITIKLLANDRDMTVSALLHGLINAEIRKSEARR